MFFTFFRYYYRNTDVFASDGFLNESLLNESQNPNILLKKLNGRKRISTLFNCQGSESDEDEVR